MSGTGQPNARNDSAPAGRVRRTDTRPGAGKDGATGKMPPRRTWLWFVAVIVANYFLVRLLMPAGESSVTVPYTLFKDEVSKGNVEAVHSQGDSITGRFKTAVTYPPATDKSAPPKADFDRWRDRPRWVLWASATFGLPPFYIISLLAGALEIRLRTFCVIGMTGRVLRFSALVALCWLY